MCTSCLIVVKCILGMFWCQKQTQWYGYFWLLRFFLTKCLKCQNKKVESKMSLCRMFFSFPRAHLWNNKVYDQTHLARRLSSVQELCSGFIVTQSQETQCICHQGYCWPRLFVKNVSRKQVIFACNFAAWNQIADAHEWKRLIKDWLLY